MKEISSSTLIFIVAVFLVLFGNITFFSNVIDIYPLNFKNGIYLLSLAVLSVAIISLLLSLVCYKFTIKPVLISVLLVSSVVSYFMDSYNVVIDEPMIDNIVKSDMAESMDLFSFKLILYFLLLGLVPAFLVFKANVKFKNPKYEIISRLKLSALSFVCVISMLFIFSGFYASFFREHKPLRYYSNPSYYMYSAGKYISSYFETESLAFESIGLDANIPPSDVHRELIVLVVGETARSDRFSLNGYTKETNPYLKNEKVISFTNFWSCGTSTAVSVPCMFSIYDKSQFEKSKSTSTENVLDILNRSGVNVVWMDNNSDSKDVALRVPYESYKTADKNPLCDVECRDEGMLVNLQAYIDSHPQGDIFIVLHQMGNHGPAYYKRYPAQFEKFTPTCKTNHLESCSKEEINNTYDNAILYTDFFLSKVIELLKQNSNQFEAGLFYISDHGESLGENGIYLHGLPDLLAPDVQKHVPMIVWFSDSFDKEEVNFLTLEEKRHSRFSHDNIFHTILGLMEVKTSVYKEDMDIINHNG